MRKSILFLLLVSSIVYAESNPKLSTNIQKQKICKQNSQIENIKRKGCCSWHGGVNGCSNGKVTCNDGSISPSCTCNNIINPLG